MTRTVPLALLALLLAACTSVNRTIEVADGETVDGNLRTVNGAVLVGDHAVINGNIETVNGRLELGTESRARRLKTVNGRIAVGADSTIESAETVNGRIDLAAGARADGSVATVNGQVSLAPGSAVADKVSAVNGQLNLDDAEAGSLVNVNGGMRLENGSRVHGELVVERSRRLPSTPPVILIGAGSEVAGPLRFEQPVSLKVHKTATIGEVHGAEIEYFDD